MRKCRKGQDQKGELLLCVAERWVEGVGNGIPGGGNSIQGCLGVGRRARFPFFCKIFILFI